MKFALFATAEVDVLTEVLPKVRAFFEGYGPPDDPKRIVVYLRDSFRDELAPLLEGLEVRSDTTRGRTRAFLGELREEKFDAAAVIMAGGKDHWKMKVLGLKCRAGSIYAFNENADGFQWNKENRQHIRAHLAWRMKQGRVRVGGGRADFPLPLRLAVQLYGLTIGPLLGAAILFLHVAWLELARFVRVVVLRKRPADLVGSAAR